MTTAQPPSRPPGQPPDDEPPFAEADWDVPPLLTRGDELPLIVPDWDAPANICACVTTRAGGVSAAPFDSFNLAEHVGDEPQAVRDNRRRLREALALPAEPAWLAQAHGKEVVEAGPAAAGARADAAVCFGPGAVCAVLTADCLPVFLCDQSGACAGVAHCGWRGLAAGALEATVAALGRRPAELLAWLGPAIGPHAFQVGDEVRAAFVADARADASTSAQTDAQDDALAFVPDNTGRWLADLYRLARARLQRLGVERIGGGTYCTYHDARRFYSFRRDGRTGRMAALIWMTP